MEAQQQSRRRIDDRRVSAVDQRPTLQNRQVFAIRRFFDFANCRWGSKISNMKETPAAQFETPTIQLADDFAPLIRIRGAAGEITICQCSRCGELWQPRQTVPAKCPACSSPLWNKPRVYQRQGAPPPTQTAKPRGRAFQTGIDSRRVQRP